MGPLAAVAAAALVPRERMPLDPRRCSPPRRSPLELLLETIW